MKRALVCFIFLWVAVSAVWGAGWYTEGVDAFCKNETEIKIVCSDRNGKPITGVVKGYFMSGALMWEAPYKNGKAEGIAKRYYTSGALSSELPYKNGIVEGLGKEYYESGALKRELPIKKGLEEGMRKTYYENGKVKNEIPYRNGKKEGIAKAYYPSGVVLELAYKHNELISGYCVRRGGGKRTTMTSAEISNWNNGLEVKCE
jgi:antitoxin component YwqK of YwqJK toxin-antitoxin module